MSDHPQGQAETGDTTAAESVPQGVTGGAGGDALLSLVEGVQRHVQMLSGLKSEIDSQAAEVARRNAELNDRFLQAAQQEAAARERCEQAEAALAAAEARRGEIEEAARALTQREEELRARGEHLEERARGAEEAGRIAAERAARAEQALGEARAAEARACERAAEVDRLSAELAAREAEFENRQREEVARADEEMNQNLEEARGRAGALGNELEGVRGELEKSREQARLAGEMVAELEARTSRREAEFQALAQRVGELEAVENRLGERDSELAVLREKLGEAEGAVTGLRGELSQREWDLGERNAALEAAEGRARELSGRVDELQSRAAEPAAEDPRVAELASRLREAEEELDGARDDVARLSLLAERARAAGASGSPAANEQRAAELTKRATEAAREAESLRASVTALEAQLSEAKSAAAKSVADSGEVEQSRRELDQAMRVIEALQTERARLSEDLRSEREAARARAEAGSTGADHTDFPDSAADVFCRPPDEVAVRRERLSRYRAALRRQRNKIDQVQGLLTERLAEAQDVATRKASLAAELQHLEQTRQKIEFERATLMKERQQVAAGANAAPAKGRKSARGERAESGSNGENQAASGGGGRGVFMAGFALALAICGAISWQVAGVIKQPVAVATMTLGMDEKNEAPTKEQQDAWASYLSDLPRDERFLDRATERFTMRGFNELGNRPSLGSTLERSLDVDATAAGRLKLSLKYPGFDRSALALDTLATTMIGFANDSMAVRSDKAATVIATGAVAANEPVEDPRLAVFGAIYGGLTALMLFAAAVVYRRAKVGDEGSGKTRRRAEVAVAQAVTVTPMMSGVEASDDPGPGTVPAANGASMLRPLGE